MLGEFTIQGIPAYLSARAMARASLALTSQLSSDSSLLFSIKWLQQGNYFKSKFKEEESQQHLDQGVDSRATAYNESDQIGFSGLLDLDNT